MKNTEREPNSDIAEGEFNEKYFSYLKDKGFRIWTAKEIKKVMTNNGFRQKTLSKHLESNGYTTYLAWLEIKWR